MFQSWKNSPHHYENMIHSEYAQADLGFSYDAIKGKLYATQVFGRRGYTVRNQLTENAFNIEESESDCSTSYTGYLNLVMNAGNGVQIQGNAVYFSYHNIDYLQKMFSNEYDGVVIDLIDKSQLSCTHPNQLDASPIYDGVLLNPIYRDELLSLNQAENPRRFIAKIGDVPSSMEGEDILPALILIKNNKKCLYLLPVSVPSKKYQLRYYEPQMLRSDSGMKTIFPLIGIDQINYTFKTNSALIHLKEQTEIKKFDLEVKQINIQSYSSVEGDSLKNIILSKQRAYSILNDLKKKKIKGLDSAQIDFDENWEMMRFQLASLELDSLQSKNEIKKFLSKRKEYNLSINWDSLLYAQRNSTAIIVFKNEYDSLTKDSSSIFESNLIYAILKNDSLSVNEIFYRMYNSSLEFPQIYSKLIFNYILKNRFVLQNASAVLSQNRRGHLYDIASFLFKWVEEGDLNQEEKNNLLDLHTLFTAQLLSDWDVGNYRLSKVIPPNIVKDLLINNVTPSELVINSQLTFIEYYSQLNDGQGLNQSFAFIDSYFTERISNQKDIEDLSLFYNSWSMYPKTIEKLYEQYKKDKITETGLFILMRTMSFYKYNSISENDFYKIYEKAIELNPERWCNIINTDFHLLRDDKIKNWYCKTCGK